MSGPFRTIEEKTGIPLMTWLPGRRDKTYRDNWERIFGKKEAQKESDMGCGKPKPRPR